MDAFSAKASEELFPHYSGAQAHIVRNFQAGVGRWMSSLLREKGAFPRQEESKVLHSGFQMWIEQVVSLPSERLLR